MKKFNIITLCGSSKFKDQFTKYNKILTLKGNIVISLGVFSHSDKDYVYNRAQKEMLDEIHIKKIDMADEIFVINVGGYIGKSTLKQVQYAYSTGKKVTYLTQYTADKADDAVIKYPQLMKKIKQDISYGQNLMDSYDVYSKFVNDLLTIGIIVQWSTNLVDGNPIDSVLVVKMDDSAVLKVLGKSPSRIRIATLKRENGEYWAMVYIYKTIVNYSYYRQDYLPCTIAFDKNTSSIET